MLLLLLLLPVLVFVLPLLFIVELLVDSFVFELLLLVACSWRRASAAASAIKRSSSAIRARSASAFALRSAKSAFSLSFDDCWIAKSAFATAKSAWLRTNSPF